MDGNLALASVGIMTVTSVVSSVVMIYRSGKFMGKVETKLKEHDKDIVEVKDSVVHCHDRINGVIESR